jgi:hypothetical protein
VVAHPDLGRSGVEQARLRRNVEALDDEIDDRTGSTGMTG